MSSLPCDMSGFQDDSSPTNSLLTPIPMTASSTPLPHQPTSFDSPYLSSSRVNSFSPLDSSKDHHMTSGNSSASLASINQQPQLMSIQEIEPTGTPTMSPLLMRPSSGRFVGGMKKLLRLPTAQAGVAASTAQADVPAVISLTSNEHHQLHEAADKNTRFRTVINKMHIKHPRNFHSIGFSGLKHPMRRKRVVSAPRRTRDHRHHYSDDGYTSDPGILREVIRVVHEEDQEEEDDTESGDREGELRAERIARLRSKLDKYKRLLQEEEVRLQDVETEYVMGMEGSMNDKDQHKLKKNFISKQSKAKDEIEQLKKKVDYYEEQLQCIQQGGDLSLSRQLGYSHKMKDHFSRIRQLGGKTGMKILRRKKHGNGSHQASMTEMEEDDMDEDEINHGDDVESEVSHTSFVNPFVNRLDKDDSHCGYCLNEYSNIMEVVDEQKELILELQREYLKLAEKLEQERDKTDRLENELNTLTDLYQNGNMELKSQLAQMERVTFSKSQDLEDNIDNCQIRLHKLEVQITNSANSSEKPLPSNGVVRKVGVPALSHLLNFIAVCFKVSEHIGKKGVLCIVIVLISIIVCYVLYNRL